MILEVIRWVIPKEFEGDEECKEDLTNFILDGHNLQFIMEYQYSPIKL